MAPEREDSRRCRERGVSHVLGVVLVVAVVLTGIVAIVGFGVASIPDSTADLSETAVERDLTGLAAAVDRATVHGEAAAGTTTVALSMAEVAESREQVTVDGQAGRLTLHAESGGVETELVNTSLGLVSYDHPDSDARIAYQSGLVFSAPDATTQPGIVRSNQFTHRSDGDAESLTLHVTRVTGQVLVDRRLAVAAGETTPLHPEVLVGGEGTPADQLVLRVDSGYSEGWELALRELLPADAAFDHDGTTLEVVYEVPDGGMFLHAYRHEVALDGR